MTPNEQKKASKFLSLVLRHQPEQIGIELDSAGWTDIRTLLDQAALHGLPLDRDSLETVVRESDKQRFSISTDGTRIRANQGHSVPVDLGLQAVPPPELLYHGTVPRFLEQIFQDGIKKMNRHAVHLSKDVETASKVGQRRGAAVILTVEAGKMHRDGLQFFCSDNGVWLTDEVPARYIQPLG